MIFYRWSHITNPYPNLMTSIAVSKSLYSSKSGLFPYSIDIFCKTEIDDSQYKQQNDTFSRAFYFIKE